MRNLTYANIFVRPCTKISLFLTQSVQGSNEFIKFQRSKTDAEDQP